MLSQHAKKLLYFRQMHSLIVYGLSIWGMLVNKSYLTKIQQIQDKCLRAIAPKLSVSECRKKHCILKIRDQVNLEQAKLGFKACKGLLPMKFASNILTESAEVTLLKTHRYDTRNKKLPYLPKVSTNTYWKSFLSTSIREYTHWNTVIPNANTLKCSATQCK